VDANLKAVVREAAGEPEGALVLFHGRGADEHDLVPLLDALDPERRLLGITPQGPLSLPPGGAHWYAFRELGYPDPATFLPTYERVSAWLDGLDLPYERTILGGFSQGAVMSYALGLGRGRPRPAGIIALSGFVPKVEGFELDLDPPLPPVAIGHGTFDPVIPVQFGRQAKALLEQAAEASLAMPPERPPGFAGRPFSPDVLYREYPLPHAIDPQFVFELRDWISDRLAAASTGRGRADTRSARSTP
jgi:phospholipase/carboxylesterase